MSLKGRGSMTSRSEGSAVLNECERWSRMKKECPLDLAKTWNSLVTMTRAVSMHWWVGKKPDCGGLN